MRPDPRALGLAAIAVALAVAAANLLLPWYVVQTSGRAHLVLRDDVMQRGGILYEQELLWLPLVAAALAGITGIALALGRPGRKANRAWVLCGAAAGATFLLCGTRWLGFCLARALDSGPTLVSPGSVPWIDVLAGIAVVVGARFLWPPLRAGEARALWAGAASGLALVALPLLPLATVDGFHVDELTLESARVVGAQGARAAVEVAQVRFLMLGVTVAAGAVLLLPARAPIEWALRVLVGLAGLGIAVLTILFYFDVPALAGGANAWPSPFMPLTAVLMLCIAAWHHRPKIGAPLARREAAPRAAKQPLPVRRSP